LPSSLLIGFTVAIAPACCQSDRIDTRSLLVRLRSNSAPEKNLLAMNVDWRLIGFETCCDVGQGVQPSRSRLCARVLSLCPKTGHEFKTLLGVARPACHLSFGAGRSALLMPHERQGFTQGFELKCRRLAAVEDHLDDIGASNSVVAIFAVPECCKPLFRSQSMISSARANTMRGTKDQGSLRSWVERHFVPARRLHREIAPALRP